MTTAGARRISASRLALETRTHALYRFYDRTDVLLYVGISVDLFARTKTHRSQKRWWDEVAYMLIERFPGRRAVLNAERTAIETEHPLYNDQYNQMAAMPPSAREESTEPCGEECDEDCRLHHGDRWVCISREELALTVVDAIRRTLRDERLFADATRFASEESDLDEYDRRYVGERGVVSTSAQYMLDEVLERLLRWYAVAESLLKEVPPGLRDAATEATRHDFDCAGQGEPTREEELPHLIRHLGHIVSRSLARCPVGHNHTYSACRSDPMCRTGQSTGVQD